MTQSSKQKWQRAAQKYHPDRPDGGDIVKFLAAKEEYEDTIPGKNNTEDRVDERLLNLFNAMLAEEQTIYGNVVEKIIKMVDKTVLENFQAQAKVEQRKAKLEKNINRLKTHKTHNLYRQLVDSQIAVADQQIASHDAEIAILKQVIERLADYEDVEPVLKEEIEISFYTTTNMG